MVNNYHLLEPATMAAPVFGRALAHSRLDLIRRSFIARDLCASVLRLTEPTQLQAAFLARVNPTYVHWAIKRSAERTEIEAGLIPLVPARFVIPKTNGNTLPVAKPTEIDNSAIVSFVRSVGINRVLEAAVAVEAAQ